MMTDKANPPPIIYLKDQTKQETTEPKAFKPIPRGSFGWQDSIVTRKRCPNCDASLMVW